MSGSLAGQELKPQLPGEVKPEDLEEPGMAGIDNEFNVSSVQMPSEE